MLYVLFMIRHLAMQVGSVLGLRVRERKNKTKQIFLYTCRMFILTSILEEEEEKKNQREQEERIER